MLQLEILKTLEISIAFQAPIKTIYKKRDKIKLSLQEKWLSEEKTNDSKLSDDELKKQSASPKRKTASLQFS